MRGALFFTISALCAVVDEASASAGAGSNAPRASRGSRASDRASRARTIAGRRKRQDEKVDSDDGCSVTGRDSSTVLIGAVLKEERDDAEGHQYEADGSPWEDDDEEEEGEEEHGDDDDDWGEGDGASSLGDEEEVLSEEREAGPYSRGRRDGGNYDSSSKRRRTASGPAPGRGPAPAPQSPKTGSSYGGARSSSNRRAYYDDRDDYGGGSRNRKGPEASPSRMKKAKASSGVMKSVGKATGNSMKALVHALQPKSVGLGEILDTWKIEQIVGKPPGRVTKCAATVEFRRDGTVATSFDGRESVSDFTFRAHSWPRACTIEFEAKAFQGPWDEEPVWKVYKGSFSRKLLDPKIIMLEGTIYDVMGKMMWKRRVKSGQFTARRRPSRLSRGGGGSKGGGVRGSSEKSVRRSRSYEEEERHRPDEERGSKDGGSLGQKAKAGGGSRRSGGGGGGKKRRKSRSSGSSKSSSSRTGSGDEL